MFNLSIVSLNSYLLTGILALSIVGMLVLLVFLVDRHMQHWKKIYVTGITKTVKKYFTTATYFRAAILVCMIVSIGHGSHLFATKENTPWLQFALAGTIDVGIWVLIEALIALRKRGYLLASISVLCGIIVLSVLSYAANFVYNQHFYDSSQFSAVPVWFLQYVPFIQSCPPLIIAFMSTVAEVFVKPDNYSDLEKNSYKDRIKALYTRKNDRLEAKLEAKKNRHELLKRYSVINNRQVSWSFLGVVKGYHSQQLDQEAVKKMEDQENKITVLTTRVEELVTLTASQSDQIKQKDTVIVSHETTIHTLTCELEKLIVSVETLQRTVEDHAVSGNLTLPVLEKTTGPIMLPVAVVTEAPQEDHKVVSGNLTSSLPVYRPKKKS